MQKFTVEHNNAHVRLDVFLQDGLPNLSRSSIKKLVDTDNVLVNNSPQKAGYKLRVGDTITVKDYEQAVADIDLPVLYEDEDCIVIDKPEGILTHSKGAFNAEPTVASFIAPKLSAMSGDKAGIVHRLDRATSGVIICAKNEDAQKWLQKQFAQRKTKKTYYAIISAGLKPKEAVIDMPIERDPKHLKQFRVGASGKPAQTHYSIIKSNNAYSLIELKPVTGRTHQLRVHLKQLGYPILGDTLYGGQPFERLMLHAQDLEITLPSRVRKTFSTPVPSIFNESTS